jgi:hypothetical protein
MINENDEIQDVRIIVAYPWTKNKDTIMKQAEMGKKAWGRLLRIDDEHRIGISDGTFQNFGFWINLIFEKKNLGFSGFEPDYWNSVKTLKGISPIGAERKTTTSPYQQLFSSGWPQPLYAVSLCLSLSLSKLRPMLRLKSNL